MMAVRSGDWRQSVPRTTARIPCRGPSIPDAEAAAVPAECLLVSAHRFFTFRVTEHLCPKKGLVEADLTPCFTKDHVKSLKL